MARVVVVGGGNAGLCAALSARAEGADVLVLDRGSADGSGSDSFFTGGLFRMAYEGLGRLEAIVGPLGMDASTGIDAFDRYSEGDFLDDWGRVTGYRCDPELAETVVAGSYDVVTWLSGHGVPFLSGIVVDGSGRARHTRPGWHGGFVEVSGAGPGLMEALLKAADNAGVRREHEIQVRAVERGTDGLRVLGRRAGGEAVAHGADAVVLASGGFQADPEWRTRALGPGWDLARVRASRYNTGRGIRIAQELGAALYGNWSGCHAVAWSVGSREAGDPKANHIFERESYPFGITVNVHGERFIDEASDFGAYTYARYGREILRQDEQRAWQLFDAQCDGQLMDEYRTKNPEAARVRADTLEDLAARLQERGVDRDRLARTVAEYNAAVDDSVEFNAYVKDGRATRGLPVEKSNWSRRLERGPFEAYEVTCGITFTFGGVRVGTDAAVLNEDGRPIPGLYACGEMVGGLYYFNYASGTGLTSGAVLGRIAGRGAAGTS